MDQTKLKEVFSDKAYVESIIKLSAEDAARSLCEKGVEVSAEDLVKVRDFIAAHKEELQNGELGEEALASVAGGVSDTAGFLIGAVGTSALLALVVGLAAISW